MRTIFLFLFILFTRHVTVKCLELIIKNSLATETLGYPQYIIEGGGMLYAPREVQPQTKESFFILEENKVDTLKGMFFWSVSSDKFYICFVLNKNDPSKNKVNVKLTRNQVTFTPSSIDAIATKNAINGWQISEPELSVVHQAQFFMSSTKDEIGIVVELSELKTFIQPGFFMIRPANTLFNNMYLGTNTASENVILVPSYTDPDLVTWSLVQVYGSTDIFYITNLKNGKSFFGTQYGLTNKFYIEIRSRKDFPPPTYTEARWRFKLVNTGANRYTIKSLYDGDFISTDWCVLNAMEDKTQPCMAWGAIGSGGEPFDTTHVLFDFIPV